MIIGHQKIWQYLIKSAEQDKLSHAYLLSGQEKLGKKTLAVEFAKSLFKDDVIKRQHPDFIFIEPQKSAVAKAAVGKEEIQISQVRGCIWRLNLKPSSGLFKIAVIDEAHCLNQEAQNCLLKTLEEPRGSTIIFLVSQHPERLFSTIVSRCQILNFYPVPKEEIKNYLRNRKISENRIEEIAKISSGKPGWAIDFLSEPERLETQKAVISDFIKMFDSDLAIRFQYANDLAKEPQKLKEIFDILLRYFRSILISSIAKTSQTKYSLQKLKDIIAGGTPSDISRTILAIKLMQETNFLISNTNVNPRLALEILMMEL